MYKKIISLCLLVTILLSLAPGLSLRSDAVEVSDDEIITQAMKYLNIKEGNCDSVNANDNGAVSVGMIQWHGCRALRLLNRILNEYLKTHTEDDAKAILAKVVNDKPLTLYDEIKNASASGDEWNNRTVDADEKAALVIFLGTDESKTIQNLQAREDLSGYLSRGRAKGLNTPALLFYYMDMENQYGASGASTLLDIARQVTGKSSFSALCELHYGLLGSTRAYVQNYIARRKSTYKYAVETLKWESAPYLVSYVPNADGASGTVPTQAGLAGSTFVVATNAFTYPSYEFKGWNARRNADGAWYVSGVGWCSEELISQKGYKKAVFSQGQTVTMDSAWLSGSSTGETFTFCATWKMIWDCAAQGHVWTEETVTQPTCAASGVLRRVCQYCGKVDEEQVLQPLGHDYGQWVTATEATCTRQGQEKRTCSRCGVTQTQMTPTTSHTPGTLVVDLAATCETEGSGHVDCTVCGKTIETLTLGAKGHTWGSWTVVSAATTTKDGLQRRRCAVCGKTEEQVIASPVHEHSYESRVVAATCTSGGYIEYTCACGSSYQSGRTASLGHDMDAGTVTVPATIHAGGVMTYTCQRCGMTMIETIPALTDCDGGVSCAGHKFKDMPAPTNWAHMGIDYVLETGLFAGESANTFVPNGVMTRAMLVMVLYRLDGQIPATSGQTFTDVKSTDWYAQAVVWASECELVMGTGNGKFSPNDPVTREQLAAILYRYAIFRDYDFSATAELTGFPDYGKISRYAKAALSWAKASGIVNGSKEGSTVVLSPGGKATRAEVAAMMMRFVEAYDTE